MTVLFTLSSVTGAAAALRSGAITVSTSHVPDLGSGTSWLVGVARDASAGPTRLASAAGRSLAEAASAAGSVGDVGCGVLVGAGVATLTAVADVGLAGAAGDADDGALDLGTA